MAKSGLKHIDVGFELTRTEWESEESHELIHGTSFPASPVERQLFYRDDEHKWYIYNGSDWVWLGGGGGGGGDMLKSVYDTDDDGVVDNSEKLEGSTKAQVQDHTPKAHTLASHSSKAHSELTGVGTDDHHVKYTDAEAKAQAEAAKLDDHGAPDDNTDLDATASKHGLMPKADKSKLDGIAPGADVTGSNPPQVHAASHENGGSDEINVAGLSGELADNQPPKAHALGGVAHNADTMANLNAKISDATLDDSSAPRDPNAHKASHQDGGSDEISVAGLAGEPTELTTHKALETGVHGLKGGVSFGVYQTSDQTIAKDTTVVLNWHAESWDIGGYFDLATEKFTPLVAGKYLFLLGVQLKSLSAGEDLMLFIDKNGVWVKMVARVNAGASSHLLVSGACILDMNGSTDYVRASVMHYDSVDRDTWGALGRTWFQGYLLPQL